MMTERFFGDLPRWSARPLWYRLPAGSVRRASVVSMVAVVAMLQVGCGPRQSSVTLKSYKDPYFPATYSVHFDECVFHTNAGGDQRFVALATHDTADGAHAILQYLEVSVYWKPVPGKTPSDSTTLDATLRYAIKSDAGVAIYMGSGFVYLKRRRWSDKLIGHIESGRLRLETQVGRPAEIIGDATITGALVGSPNSNRTIDLMRQIDLLAGGTLEN